MTLKIYSLIGILLLLFSCKKEADKVTGKALSPSGASERKDSSESTKSGHVSEEMSGLVRNVVKNNRVVITTSDSKALNSLVVSRGADFVDSLLLAAEELDYNPELKATFFSSALKSSFNGLATSEWPHFITNLESKTDGELKAQAYAAVYGNLYTKSPTLLLSFAKNLPVGENRSQGVKLAFQGIALSGPESFAEVSQQLEGLLDESDLEAAQLGLDGAIADLLRKDPQNRENLLNELRLQGLSNVFLEK